MFFWLLLYSTCSAVNRIRKLFVIKNLLVATTLLPAYFLLISSRQLILVVAFTAA